MKKLLSVLVVLVAGLVMTTQVDAQGGNRGAEDSRMEAAQRSVENQLVVEEMENAGFELDVEEGFDEEWEEDLWVGSEAEDVDPLHVDPSEAAKYDLADVPEAEEIEAGWSEDSWENPELVIATQDDAAMEQEDAVEIAEEGAMRGDVIEEAEAFDLEIAEDLEDDLSWEEEVETAELNWWEDGSQWDEVIDDLDTYGEDYEEEEDLDLLEELFERG